MKRAFYVIFSILVLGFFITETQATVISVPSDQSSIQAGLNAAAEGDTVLVAPGTYNENIFWPSVNGICLTSSGDSSNTIIDAQSIFRVITFPDTAIIDSSTVLHGFLLRGGDNVSKGGAIYSILASPRLESLLIESNTCSFQGGGIFLENVESSKILNVEFANNVASQHYGGAMYINSSDITISNIKIDNCSDLSCQIENSLVYINNLIITNCPNRAMDLHMSGGVLRDIKITGCPGAGLSLTSNYESSDLYVVNANISHNQGKGLYIDSKVTIDSSLVFNNQNGGVSITSDGYGENAIIENTIIANNYINSAYQGSAITCNNNSVISNCTIAYNRNIGNGSIQLQGNGPSIHNCSIYGNTSNAIYSSNYQTGKTRYSNIVDNDFGLRSIDGAGFYSADSNYWGHYSGPYNVLENPTGLGDSTSVSVSVDDFLTNFSTNAPPIPPNNIVASNVTRREITLSWDTSLLPDLAGYRVYIDSDSAGYPYADSVDVGMDTSYTFTNLLVGETYHMAVITYDMEGNRSWYSQNIEATTVLPVTIHVPDDYSTIQTGLNAASEGDKVVVAPGTYNENIMWPSINSIKLEGSGDAEETVIDGGNSAGIIVFPGNDLIDSTTVIRNFTMTNGNAGNGSAIHCNEANPKIANCLFTNNITSSDQYGGTVACINATVIVDSCSFTGNTNYTADITGDDSNLHVRNSSFTGDDSKAIFLIFGGESTFNNLKIFDSHGGIYASYGCNLTANNIEIVNAENAIRLFSSVSFTGCKITISDNATIGMFEQSSDVILSNSIIKGNQGSFYVTTGSTIQIENSVITENSFGFDVYGSQSAYDSELRILNSSFIGNHGKDINVSGSYSRLYVDNSIFLDNNGSERVSIDIESADVVTVNNSNFLSNENSASSLIPSDFTNCWWGSSTGPYHPAQNPGGIGDSVNAFVNVTPWLTTPDLVAPPMPPSGVEITETQNTSLTVEWDRSPLADASFYRIYFDTDTTGYPYSSSIDVGSDTTYTFTGLTPSTTYYIATTVVDTTDNESWYSQELQASTRTTEAQNLDIGGNEDIEHLVTHDPTIKFSYYDSMGDLQSAYDIEVASNAEFDPVDMWDTGWVSSSDTSVVYGGQSLGDGQTYCLRVRVKTADGFEGNWSNLQFRMNSKPSTISPVSPANEAILNNSENLVCTSSFDGEGDNVTYSFSVYNDESCETLVRGVDDIADTTWTVSPVLADDQMYWWTCYAHDGYESSDTSDTWSFLLNMQDDPPASFSLSDPVNGSTCVTGDTTLAWEVAFDPDYDDMVSYIVLFSRTDDFTSLVDSFTTTGTELEVHDLQHNQTYWWKVRAQDSNSPGTWSTETWAINGYEPQAPGAFSLYLPENNLILDTLSYTFEWEESTDPDPDDEVQYHLALSLREDFNDSTTVFYHTGQDSVWIVPYMQDDTDYWWRVIAMDMDGHSTFSNEIWTFHTAWPEPPHPFELNGGGIDMNATGDSVVVTLEWQRTWDPDPESLEYYAVLLDTTEDMNIPIILADSVQVAGSDTMFVWTHTYAPEELPMLGDGFWTVYAYDNNTEGTWADEPMAIFMTSVNDSPWGNLPVEYEFAAAYPNPFNPTLTAVISLPQPSDLTVQVFNVMGQRVATIAEGQFQEGFHSFVFDGQNMASGVYFVIANVPGKLNQVKKVVLMK